MRTVKLTVYLDISTDLSDTKIADLLLDYLCDSDVRWYDSCSGVDPERIDVDDPARVV